MATQIAEALRMPRGKKSIEDMVVIYAKIPPWLKFAVEDEVLLAKRNGHVESLTSFTEAALTQLVNKRRQERGLSPIEKPSN